MTNRTKTTLRAPDGVEESIICGTYYWPEEDGEISTTNPDHVKILVQHGYVITGEISVMRPAVALGAIDTDELGRQALASAMRERGLSFPESASRADLAEIAEAWNQARRRGRVAGSAPEPEKTAPEAPRAVSAPRARVTPPAPAQPPSGPAGEVDFGAASYDELKGWLVAHGVAFPGNTPKNTLREMAVTAHAELKTKTAA